MGRVHNVSTAGIPVGERIIFWNSGSREIGSVRATPLGGKAFEAEAATRKIGPLLVFSLRAGPHRVSSAGICPAGRPEPFVRLRYQCSGKSIVEQGEVKRVLRPGEWIILDGARAHSMTNEEEASQLSLQVPRSVLSERDFRLAQSLSGPFAVNGRVSKTLFECLRLSIEDLDDLSELTEQGFGLSMLELFRATISDVAPAQEHATSRDAMEGRVRDYVRRHLCDPDLSVDMIARAMGCSPRYIHKVFEGQESVSRMIWAQRLDHCHMKLKALCPTNLSLTELAFEVGFSSSAHFSRAFKERFGVAPSTFRMRILEEADEGRMLN